MAPTPTNLKDRMRELGVLTEMESIIDSMNDSQKEALDLALKNVSARQQEYEFSKAVFNDLSNSYKVDQARLESERERLKLTQIGLNLRRQMNLITEEEYVAEAKKLVLQERGLNAYQSAKEKIEGLAGLLGMTQAEKSPLFLMLSNPKETFDGVAKGLNMLFNPLNLLITIMEKSIEASIAQDAALADFNATTGQTISSTDGLSKAMSEAANSVRMSGVTEKEVSNATKELFANFNQFSSETKDVQQELIKTTAVLEKFGIDAAFSSRNVSTLTKAFNMSSQEASKFNTRFSTISKNLKIPINDLTKGFSGAEDALLAMSSNSGELDTSFTKLAKLSKDVGLGMDSIVKLTTKFDTFDGAAKAVGGLNALLGGPYLNTLEMISETDLTERYKKISEAVELAGMSFNTMSKSEKLALQNQLGLESMAELAAVLAGEVDNIEPPEAAMTQEQLIDMQRQTVAFRNIMDEIKVIAMQLAIGFGPVITAIKEVVSGISYFMPLIKTVISLFGLWTVAQTIYNGVAYLTSLSLTSMVNGMFNLAANGIVYAIEGIIALNGALNTNKIAFMTSLLGVALIIAGVMYYLGESILYTALAVGALTIGIYLMSAAEKTSLILLGLSLVAAGIAAIAHSLAVGNSPSLIEAFIMSAVAIGIFAIATNFMLPLLITALPVIAGLAFSALMLGAGFALAGLGLMLAGQGAILMGQGLMQIVQAMAEGGYSLPLQMIALAGALGILGLASIASVIPIGFASLALVGFAYSATLAAIPIMLIAQSITMVVESMTSLIQLLNVNLVEVFNGMGQGIAVIAEQIANIPIAQTIALTALVIAATPLAAMLGPAMIATGIATSIFSPGQSKEEAKSEKSGSSTEISGSPAEITFNLNLNIDGNEFGKVVNKVSVDPVKDRALYTSIRRMITSGMESV